MLGCVDYPLLYRNWWPELTISAANAVVDRLVHAIETPETVTDDS